jgi:hypothetical protein
MAACPKSEGCWITAWASSLSSWVEIEPAVLVGVPHRVQVEEAVDELEGDAAALEGAVLADDPRPPEVQDEVVQPNVGPDDVAHRSGVVIRWQQEREPVIVRS